MFVIRPATVEDAEALSAVARQTFHDGWAAIISAQSAATYSAAYLTAARFVTEIADPSLRLLVATNSANGSILGYLKLDWARPAHESVPSDDAVCLQRLYVVAEGRGLGVADALLATAATGALSRGKDVIWLECEPRNQRAWRFYAKRGFTEVGKTIYHYPDGYNDNIRILVKRISLP